MRQLAVAIQVASTTAEVLRVLSWTHQRCPGARLEHLVVEGSAALQDAVQDLQNVLLAQPANESPKFKSEAPSGVYFIEPKVKARASFDEELDDEEDEDTREIESEWDPEPVADAIEAQRCRALLLEVIRRAAHDWVLYRQHERLQFKQVAEDAYVWLFEEEPGHPHWELRKQEGRMSMGFLPICEALDLDPETVRERVRKMTIKDIMGAGRPAERRQVKNKDGVDDTHYAAHGVAIRSQADLNTMDDVYHRSSYENHYATNTPGYL